MKWACRGLLGEPFCLSHLAKTCGVCLSRKARGVKQNSDVDKNSSGKDLEKRMDRAHITCNKNTIPNDPRSPFVTSGVRLGTPAVTTRGMVEEDMDVIAEAIALVIESEDNVEKVREMVAGLTAKYPLK